MFVATVNLRAEAMGDLRNELDAIAANPDR
jgi:hypothetical protein